MHKQNSGHNIEPSENETRGILSRSVWIVVGWLSLALGAIGVPLPLLPTTPFLILAAFAFGRGSPILRHRLLSHPRFGPLITDWERHGVIAPRYKILACSLMAGVFSAGVYFDLSTLILTIQALFMGSAALFILTRPGKPAP